MRILKKLSLVAFPVKDWQAAKKFYGETLELPVAWFHGDEVGWIQYGDENGAQLALYANGDRPAWTNTESKIDIIFDVDDAYKAVEELRAKGVRCDDVIPVPGFVTYANIYDLEGNRLQLVGPPPAA